jgi:hypothetical protein
VLRRPLFFTLLAIGQVALLARNHLRRVTRFEWRRLASLVRRGWELDAS